jgi:hypothetical protein
MRVPVLFHAANTARTPKTSVLPHYLGARVALFRSFPQSIDPFRLFLRISWPKCPFVLQLQYCKLLFLSLMRNTRLAVAGVLCLALIDAAWRARARAWTASKM